MEPQGGEHEQQQLVPGKKKKVMSNDGATAAAAAGVVCLCPTAVALPLPDLSARRELLEQEVLARADLQLQLQGGDRRGERRMRNRASAERSRARRHAYVNDLEAEVRVLRQENQQLKSLCQELKEAAEVQQVPPVKKKTTTTTTRLLQRTSSSSPF